MIQRFPRATRPAALMLGLALLAPLPAAAQYGPGALPPYEISTILRSTGLQPLTPPFRRGPNYVLRAIDRRGVEVRVVVDARDGDILAVHPTRSAALMPPEARFYRGPYDRSPPPTVYEDDDDDDFPPQASRPLPPSIDRERPIYPPGSVPERYSSAPYGEPRVIPAPRNADPSGALPAPPDRFERRAPQTSRPAPSRSVSNTRTNTAPPIPRPRPEIQAAPEPAKSWSDPAPASAPPAQDAAPLPPAAPASPAAPSQPNTDDIPN